MLEIETTEQFETEVINNNKPALVDFYTQWCGPCRMLTPIVEEVAKEKSETLVVCKVDGDKHASLMQKYGVSAVPTLLLMKNGKVVDQHVGVLPKDSLLKWIDEKVAD